LREALAKNPSHKIQGLACYQLARFLDDQGTYIPLGRLIDAGQLRNVRIPIRAESWGHDYEARLLKSDPGALEGEAAVLYEQVVKEFSDLPLPNPLPNPTGDRSLPGRPVTLGAAAKRYLHELTILGIGQPPPEFDGVDLDGRRMRLSEYRGKVVAIYFCGSMQLGGSRTNRPAAVTEYVRSVSKRHANEPFALVGVSTGEVGRTITREVFKSLLNASGLPARFWWDVDPKGQPGPIQTAWSARVDLYLLDRHGMVRYKHVLRPDVYEKAVTTLLREQENEVARSKKNN
jgi:hypothetical protein